GGDSCSSGSYNTDSSSVLYMDCGWSGSYCGGGGGGSIVPADGTTTGSDGSSDGTVRSDWTHTCYGADSLIWGQGGNAADGTHTTFSAAAADDGTHTTFSAASSTDGTHTTFSDGILPGADPGTKGPEILPISDNKPDLPKASTDQKPTDVQVVSGASK